MDGTGSAAGVGRTAEGRMRVPWTARQDGRLAVTVAVRQVGPHSAPFGW